VCDGALKRLFVILSILGLSLLLTGCWMTPLTVDSRSQAGMYISSVNKPAASWIVPAGFMESYYYFPIARNTADTLYGLTKTVTDSSSLRFYSKRPGYDWTYTTLTTECLTPDWLDVATDSTGIVHGSYLDINGDTGLYYFNNDGNYTTYKIDTGAIYATRIAVDGTGNRHIINTNNIDGALNHYYVSGTVWQKEKVGNGYFSQAHSLAIGPGNTVNVAMGVSSALIYSVKSASVWSTQTVSNDFYPGFRSGIGLVLKSNGTPLIAYFNSAQNLILATKAGSSWSFETVSNSYDAGYNGLSMKLDRSENPWIAYVRNDNTVRVSHKTSTGWVHKDLLSNSHTFAWPFLSLNSKGYPEIVVCDYSGQNYFLAQADNVTHISYFNDSTNQVMHGTRWGDVVSTEEVATTLGNAFTSISLDTAGNPMIVYKDSGNSVLYSAFQIAGEWVADSIMNLNGSSGEIGGRPVTLQIGTDNKPQMAIIGGSGAQLMYASKSGSTWSFSTISNYLVDAGLSLALDTGNKPHIAFSIMSSNSAISYAYKSGNSWVVENIGDTTSNRTGFWNSIGLDKKNDVYISYRDSMNASQKFAWRKNGVWKFESISTADNAGTFNSLQIDKDGTPHIAFDAYDTRTLYYARLIEKNGRKWLIESPDTTSFQGSFNSMALEEGFNPNISYYANTSTLKNVRNKETFYNLPDIKMLNGTGIATAFHMNRYIAYPEHEISSFYRLSGEDANPVLYPDNGFGYSVTTVTSYSLNTFAITANDTFRNLQPSYLNVVKYSDFLVNKLPKVIFEGITPLGDTSLLLGSYIQKSPLYSGPTSITGYLTSDYPEDRFKVNGSLNEYQLSIGNLTSPLKGKVELGVIARATTNSWDMEWMRMYPLLNNHSGFTTAADTAQWAYENTDDTNVKPAILFDGSKIGPGGTQGSLALQFTGVNQGVKMTAQFANWLKTEPNEWYTLRVLVKADGNTPANNNVTLGVYAYNGVPPAETDIAAHLVFTVSTGWKWFEVPLYSSGTSMYPQLLIKNGTTTTVRILVNKWEIIKAKPDTEMVYGTPKVEGATQTFDSSAELNRWAFENMNPALEGVNGAPTYQVRNGELMFDFYDTAYRGIKFTSAVTTGVVRTGAVTPGKGAGMSVKFRSEGSLFYPLVLLAAFGTDSVNKADFKELAAFANIYHINTNKKSEIRFGYVSNMPYVYQQVQIKNGGPSRFFFDEVNLEADQDTDNYWDSTLIPDEAFE
jgi:hypothetical protein